jgi:uncharacterized metal-binding protein
MGVGKALAVAARRAAYLAHNARRECTVLLSVPALLAGDSGQQRLIRRQPVILVNGCAQRCGSHILAGFGVQPVAVIEAAKVMAETKTGPGTARRELADSGKRLADILAERIVRAMDEAAPLPPAGPLAPQQGKCACMNVPKHPSRPERGCESPRFVTLLPCQGIRRRGARVGQRAAYCLDEDVFPGKTLLLCIPALASAVQEDVDMLEQFPVVAIDGCGSRCATAISRQHGVEPAVQVDAFGRGLGRGAAVSVRPDLTGGEARAGVRLADKVAPLIHDLLDGKRPRRGARRGPRRGASKAACCCKGKGGAPKTS